MACAEYVINWAEVIFRPSNFMNKSDKQTKKSNKITHCRLWWRMSKLFSDKHNLIEGDDEDQCILDMITRGRQILKEEGECPGILNSYNKIGIK